ncbi:hypothetical protein CIT292_06258 [Citrobacter youngae ATCC 29220]|uniref:Uncharacterized protein n=1 Tax=Citrobacter youngae ATCC 29220 TaxID=500640 RepID=D4B7G2_9ENTR|nr:hypothetical protein CIT292_06258 [Citrobacter youngae ATCC 29220]
MSGVAMPSLYTDMIHGPGSAVLTPRRLHHRTIAAPMTSLVYIVEIASRSAVLSENEKKRFAPCPA